MFLRIMFTLLVLFSLPSFAKEDKPGCKDHPLFNRLPNMYIKNCREWEFTAKKFKVGTYRKNVDQTLEGRVTENIYNYEGQPLPSALQFIRNYQNAIKAIGGEVLYEDENRNTTLKFEKDGQEYWANVDKYGPSYLVVVLEKQAMKQEIVANAEALAESLRTKGHASVYGIYFDTGSSVVRPESKPSLAEIAKLMTNNPALKLRVVGHTDSVGTLESNMKLSHDRGGSVVKVLTTEFKMTPERLTGHGVGPLCPVATNHTDEGKAKNRRVELIEQ